MSGPFDITEFPKGESNFKKPVYFKATVGNRIVRIILDKVDKTWVHYIKNAYVACLGKDECPVCQRNTKLRAEFGKDAKDHGYLTTSQHFCVNVLEKTPAIVCPSCQTENFANLSGKMPQACAKCSAILVKQKAEPLNKVKLLSGGVELFSLLNGYAESQLDDEGNPLGLGNFDINLMGTPNGTKVKITPIPMPEHREPLEIDEEDLFDPSVSVSRFSAQEINDLERGVSIRDIYLSRKSNQESEINKLGSETVQTADEITKQLFSM